MGAKAITFRRAVVLGTICEALGCILVGVETTPLFLLNVIHYQAWIPSPQLAIFVIVCAQACASIWVLLATHFRLSASILHAVGETAVQQVLLCLPAWCTCAAAACTALHHAQCLAGVPTDPHCKKPEVRRSAADAAVHGLQRALLQQAAPCIAARACRAKSPPALQCSTHCRPPSSKSQMRPL